MIQVADECSYLRPKREAEREQTVLRRSLRCSVPHVTLKTLKKLRHKLIVSCTHLKRMIRDKFGVQAEIKNTSLRATHKTTEIQNSINCGRPLSLALENS